MRILFYPYHIGMLATDQRISPSTGVPMSVRSDMVGMKRDLSGCTENVGNVIHVEAPARILRYNRRSSTFTYFLDLYRLHDGDTRAIANQISEEFDYLILSEANVFRWHGRNKEESESNTKRLSIISDIISKISIPYCLIGAGIQNTNLPTDLDKFDKNIAKFIRECSRGSRFIAVRGRATRDWLNKVGIEDRVYVTGCPSFFVYPDNIKRIKFSGIDSDTKVVSSGYFRDAELRHQRARVGLISELSKYFNVDYIFQDDFYQLLADFDGELYNEATGQVNRTAVDQALKKFGFDAEKIGSFYHFRNSYSWRVKCSHYDLYIGDRLHGGVVSMQAGIPAIIIQNDVRVREITDLFRIPAIEVEEARKRGIKNSIERVYNEDSLNLFNKNYCERYEYFKNILLKGGLHVN